jgi:hypothetical protein
MPSGSRWRASPERCPAASPVRARDVLLARRLPPCIAILGLWSAWPAIAAAAQIAASGQGGPKVVVIEAPATTAPARRRLDIRASVEAAARAAGAEIVSTEGIPLPLVSCTGSDCARELGRAIDARFMLAVEAAYVDDGFKLRVEMYDTRTGRPLVSDGQTCDICPFPAFVKALGERASAVCTRAFADGPAELDPAPASAQPAPPPLPRAPAPARSYATWRDRPPRPAAVATGGGARRVLSGMGVGLGVLGVAAGVYLVTLDGQPACSDGQSPCPFRRDTRRVGGATAAAGAVVALVSGLLWYTAPRGVEVGVGPGGLAVASRF